MNITCPGCGANFPITAGSNDAEARRFAVMMGELPPAIARLMPAYLALHKPLKQGLRWSKMVKLLQDIAPEIAAAQVSRDGITHAAPLALWVDALDKLIDMPNLVLPLVGNGLLRKILADMAARASGAQEVKREQQQQARPHADRTAGPKPVAELLTTEQKHHKKETARIAAGKMRETIK